MDAEVAPLGVADKVAPDDEILELAMQDAREFAPGPTTAYAAIKDAIRIGYDLPLSEGMGIEAKRFSGAFKDQGRTHRHNGVLFTKELPKIQGW